MLRSLLAFFVRVTLLPVSLRAINPAQDLESRRKALHDLIDEQWEYQIRHNPTYASILGDKGYNNQVERFIAASHRRRSRTGTPFPPPLRSHRHDWLSRSGNPQLASDGSRHAHRPRWLSLLALGNTGEPDGVASISTGRSWSIFFPSPRQIYAAKGRWVFFFNHGDKSASVEFTRVQEKPTSNIRKIVTGKRIALAGTDLSLKAEVPAPSVHIYRIDF